MIALGQTDLEWFRQLRESIQTRLVNFWTPTPWNLRQLSQGDKFYFFLKSPVSKVGGYGIFERYENMSSKDAWDQFGTGNGTKSLLELVNRVTKYALRRSETFIPTENPVIGCIILRDPVFFDEQDFFSPGDHGLEFSSQIQKFKYFYIPDISRVTTEALGQSFELVEDAARRRVTSTRTDRQGQPLFRSKVLGAYHYTCAISGETCEETLEAAHIQPYVNPKSNHIQNGLALRADLHKLFDAGLLTVEPRYTVRVSDRLTSETYRSFHGTTIAIPTTPDFQPSLIALQYHNEVIFR